MKCDVTVSDSDDSTTGQRKHIIHQYILIKNIPNSGIGRRVMYIYLLTALIEYLTVLLEYIDTTL